MTIQTPDWVKHAVFYQIFPDRFARSQKVKPKPGVVFKPWGSPPEEQGFQGGDLYGVAEKLDYLVDLGVNAIYLNPIFASAANHRYHTFDYTTVDPLLGGDEAFSYLLDTAHDLGIRVVLDGVFNHASRGFWPFHHILENGSNSPYIDWFIIENWPLRPYNNGPDSPANYSAWWGLPALPKLNTANKDVQNYIFDIAEYWIDFGIDGWRLDVPMEIDDDAFWRHFRYVVKRANPEAYICGEIWENAQRWLQGDQYDAVMNYIFSWGAMSFAGAQSLRSDYNRDHLSLEPRNAAQFGDVIDGMYGLYDWEINFAQLNLLDSHDTARALWIMGEDVSALQLCVFLQMTMPGAPCIYYGDEIGMSSGDDPHCREAFPWQNKEIWNYSLLQFYRGITRLRHQYEILRVGSYQRLFAEEKVFAFKRTLGNQVALVVVNSSTESMDVQLKLTPEDPQEYSLVWPSQTEKPLKNKDNNLSVHLVERSGAVLISKYTEQ